MALDFDSLSPQNMSCHMFTGAFFTLPSLSAPVELEAELYIFILFFLEGEGVGLKRVVVSAGSDTKISG